MEYFLNFEWKDGLYPYGGAWEKTYVNNEIGAFISLFGGDYYNWENSRTKEAAGFLYQIAAKGQTSREQLLEYAAGKEGSIDYAVSMNRLSCREDLIKTEDLDITGYNDMKEYLEGVSLQARPLPENSMEYIFKIGILFQKYITGELTLDRYSRKMQELVDNIRK